MKISEGFQAADDRNLPKVDYIMLLEYMQGNECFNIAETRGAKALLASREAYVDSAVGYVQVKRTGDICTVKCRITPEHRVRSKLYEVTADINEKDEKIIMVACNDCAASAGGCKHAICFAMWLIKRSDEPAVTSVACYWKRPKLASSVTEDKFILAKDICETRKKQHGNLSLNISLDSFLTECKRQNIGMNSLIMQYKVPQLSLKDYCVFNLLLEFVNASADHSYLNFKNYSESILNQEVIDTIKEKTKDQAKSKLWHSMRKGRITGSKIHEAAHCATEDGALVQTILGGYKVPETKAMKRGKRLEPIVIKQLQNELKEQIQQTGFILITPIVGASPDGVCENFVIEVKCPMYERTVKNYVRNNCITEKFKAQIMLQMHAAQKSKGLFCVVDPTYDKTKVIHKLWVDYDESYIQELINKSELFWTKYVFPKLLESVK